MQTLWNQLLKEPSVYHFNTFIGFDKQNVWAQNIKIFSNPSVWTYVLCAQKNRHICFGWEIRKLTFWYALLTKGLTLQVCYRHIKDVHQQIKWWITICDFTAFLTQQIFDDCVSWKMANCAYFVKSTPHSFTKLPFVVMVRSLFCLFLSGRFTQVLLYVQKEAHLFLGDSRQDLVSLGLPWTKILDAG